MSAREPNGVDYSTASSSAAYNATQQPVSMYRPERGAGGGEEDQVASSSTMEQESANSGGKLKNKKRQPKYRATKRPPSERRFQCDHCESRFFTQKDVKRHLVVHTGIRNFACPYCTQRFGRKDHLVRHAKKSHDQDTRSFKRRVRPAPLGASSSSATESTSKRPSNRKGSSRSRRKTGETERDQQHFQPSTSASNATVPTTSITSPSTSYYLHDNGFNNNSLNRAAAATSTHPHFSNSTIMLSSTSTSPFPKMTLVDVHSSTSTLTASLTHPRNYHSSFNYESPNSVAAGSNFNYNINGASATTVATFNQFLPPPPEGSASGSNAQYALQLSAPPPPPPENAYLNYDYKPPPANSSLNYPGGSSHHEAFTSSHLSGAVSGGHSNGAGNLSFKTITAEGFNNTCIELEYNAAAAAAAGMASAFASIAPAISSSSVPFGEGGQHVATRFHSPFN